MSGLAGNALDRLRRPEYTGENRCLPCTFVNAAIAVVGSLLVGLLWPVLGAVFLVGAAFLIYVRGYLVPGTPELVKRYLPQSILRRFDHHPAARSEERADDEPEWETLKKVQHEREHAVDAESFLVEVGAVDPDADRTLQSAFADEVDRRMAAYRSSSVSPEAVADLFQVSPDGLAFEDREYPAMKVGVRIRKWPSEGALVSDVAVHEALADLTDRWLEVPLEQRVDILETLRTYLDHCPHCGGDLAFHDETVDSCCGRYEVAVFGCVDCEERLAEFDPALVDADPTATGIVPDLDQR